MDIWKQKKWTKYYSKQNIRSGLHMRFDKKIPCEIKWPCYMFCEWIRDNYDFPIRLPIYFKASMAIKCMDGEYVSAKFFCPFDRLKEPYISIATGDFDVNANKYGTDDALFAMLCTIAHEITHYYQWINDLQDAEDQKEFQAKETAIVKVKEYLCELGMSTLMDIYDQWKQANGRREE